MYWSKVIVLKLLKKDVKVAIIDMYGMMFNIKKLGLKTIKKASHKIIGGDRGPIHLFVLGYRCKIQRICVVYLDKDFNIGNLCQTFKDFLFTDAMIRL
jgi:hypothetical protein